MQIRKALIKDVKKVAVLFDAYRVFYQKTSDLNGAKEFLENRIKRRESIIYLAENETNGIVGFVQLYPLFSSTQMKRLWLLNDLFVAEAERGKGFSVLLIEAAKQLCVETNASGLMLETAKTNLVGNNLYPKEGFVLDEEHNYYSWENM